MPSVARHAPFNPPRQFDRSTREKMNNCWLISGQLGIFLLYCKPKTKEGYDYNCKGSADEFTAVSTVAFNNCSKCRFRRLMICT